MKRTSVKKKTLSPVWNETFELSIPPGAGLIILDMFNENRITRDDFLGRAVIDLSQIQSGKHLKTVKQLFQRSEKSNVSGKKNIIIIFIFLIVCHLFKYCILQVVYTLSTVSYHSHISYVQYHMFNTPGLRKMKVIIQLKLLLQPSI